MKLKTLALSLLAAGVLAGCSAHSSVDTMKSDKISLLTVVQVVTYQSIHLSLKRLHLHNTQTT